MGARPPCLNNTRRFDARRRAPFTGGFWCAGDAASAGAVIRCPCGPSNGCGGRGFGGRGRAAVAQEAHEAIPSDRFRAHRRGARGTAGAGRGRALRPDPQARARKPDGDGPASSGSGSRSPPKPGISCWRRRARRWSSTAICGSGAKTATVRGTGPACRRSRARRRSRSARCARSAM